jgi:hypothetical protein
VALHIHRASFLNTGACERAARAPCARDRQTTGAARLRSSPLVVLLGSPRFYGRFGFRPAVLVIP